MNILVLTPWFPDHPGDQYGNFILDSIDSLCEIGHTVHVLVMRPFLPDVISVMIRRKGSTIRPEMYDRGFSLSYVYYASIPRFYLRFITNGLYILSCAGAVRRIISENGIDVILAHTEASGTLACAVADERSIPVVTVVHGIETSWRYLHGAGQPAFLRRAFSRPDRLILVGEPLREFVSNYVDSFDHVRIVHNGFREQGAAPFRNRRVFACKDSVQIISVSNLVEGKGIDVNLAALARPEVKALSNWHYHIVGGGLLRSSLEAQARELNIAERVTFHGQCDHNVVFQLLSSCDLFSMPSSPEAFGVAYLEAMACGLLAIGVQGQGPSCFIENGRTGILIREGDVDGLALQFLNIFTNPECNTRMAEAGRDYVWDHCTWRNHAESLTDVLYEVVK